MNLDGVRQEVTVLFRDGYECQRAEERVVSHVRTSEKKAISMIHQRSLDSGGIPGDRLMHLVGMYCLSICSMLHMYLPMYF